MLVATTSAQHFAETEWKVNEGEGAAVFGPAHATPILTGEPYSADEVQEHTPPDGTSRPISAVIGHSARDAQGRTRTEQGYKWPPISLTEIIDPVAGVAYLLDDQKKIAHRMLLTPATTPEQFQAPRATGETTRKSDHRKRNCGRTPRAGRRLDHRNLGNRRNYRLPCSPKAATDTPPA